MAKYKTIKKGELFSIAKNMKIACCDCGLVHKFEVFSDEKGFIWMRTTRDRRATAAMRREDRKRRAKEACYGISIDDLERLEPGEMARLLAKEHNDG